MKKFLIFILIPMLLPACKSPPKIVENPAVEVLEPEFEIVSISIIKGELINTQFEAVLKIGNPNEFPVELSTIKYELYGNRMFWADGIENDIIRVPAKDSGETKFRFSMNFINMNRRLLDDVISMKQVQYDFKGNAVVKASSLRAQSFTMDFNCSGLSEVKQKADD